MGPIFQIHTKSKFKKKTSNKSPKFKYFNSPIRSPLVHLVPVTTRLQIMQEVYNTKNGLKQRN